MQLREERIVIVTERPKNDAHAAQVLGDAPFIAYALMQAFKLFTSLVCKRWPELR